MEVGPGLGWCQGSLLGGDWWLPLLSVKRLTFLVNTCTIRLSFSYSSTRSFYWTAVHVPVYKQERKIKLFTEELCLTPLWHDTLQFQIFSYGPFSSWPSTSQAKHSTYKLTCGKLGAVNMPPRQPKELRVSLLHWLCCFLFWELWSISTGHRAIWVRLRGIHAEGANSLSVSVQQSLIFIKLTQYIFFFF